MSLMVGPAGNNPLNEKQPTGRTRKKVDKLEIMEERRAREVTFSRKSPGYVHEGERDVCLVQSGVWDRHVLTERQLIRVRASGLERDLLEISCRRSRGSGNGFCFSDFSNHKEGYMRIMQNLEKTRQGRGTLATMMQSLACWWDEINAEIGVMDTEDLKLCVQSMERMMGKVRDELRRTETTLDVSDLEFLQRECGFLF